MKDIPFGIILLSIMGLAVTTEPYMKTALRRDGSVPPVKTPFKCVAELNGRAYSRDVVRDCEAKLSQLPYILQTKVESTELADGTMLIEFLVKSKPLIVEEMLLHVPDQEDVNDLRNWLERDPNNLRVGAVYTSDGEAATYEGIKQFFLTRGQLAGIVPSLRLEFNRGTASVKFEVIKGPQIASSPAYPPYGRACEDKVAYVDWSQVDEFVPVAFVASKLSLGSPGSCFTLERIRTDKTTLLNSRVLRAASIDYSGLKGERRLSYRLTGKQLPVSKVAIRSYGLAQTCVPKSEQDLPLKSHETYTRGAASRSIEQIRQSCSHPDLWVEVTEEDKLTTEQELQVTFNVLAFSLQSVFIDGERVE